MFSIAKDSFKEKIFFSIQEENNSEKLHSLLCQIEQVTPKITQQDRNDIFERSLFYTTSTAKAKFLLQNNDLLKVNRLGIQDVLRLSVARGNCCVAAFILNEISAELMPERDVLVECFELVKKKNNPQLEGIFNAYLENQEGVCASRGEISIGQQAQDREDAKSEREFMAIDVALEETEVIDSSQEESNENNKTLISILLTYFCNNILRK